MLKWFILHDMEGIMLRWGWTPRGMQLGKKVKQETGEEQKHKCV